MTTVKTIALARWTFVGKVMSLPFNMLSRLVIAFLSRSVSFNFMAAVTICSDFGAESEEELKRLLTKVKEESEQAGLKLNIQKTKIMASSLITSLMGKQWIS